ncbi:DUF58 domain-containing protein [Methanofollis formosanus]|uniref:DUF58 domain-containing protein n=1 Tax=Methanofollis formosanus TaxID=299308 RepID=A0A8G1A376_9EURY|nr:DUF58 domain-containing protein [Methanofollis formosanus]QYZ79569.1 DUF58 domain-containing protein [Methanofollis formosanus]
MKPGPAAEGTGVLALAVTAYALLFDDPAGFVVAGALLVYLVYRAHLFLRNITRVVGSLAIFRKVERTIVRQGGGTGVETTVTYEPRPGLAVGVEDLVPPVAVQDGEQAYDTPESGKIVVRHRLKFMAAGVTAFGGIRLAARDPFFSGSLDLKHSALMTPSITVIPTGTSLTSAAAGSGFDEHHEEGQAVLLKGQETRSYREYVSGDPFELVDWKLSARHGKLYIREPEAMSGGSPCVIVDLPDPGHPLSDDEMTRYSMAVNGAVEGTYRRYGVCPLLLIAGGEVVASLPPEVPEEELFGALAMVRPTEQTVPVYRYLDAATVQTHLRGVRKAPGWEGTFRERLGTFISSFGSEDGLSYFWTQVTGTLRRSRSNGVYLCTPGRGDISHLVQVVLEARHLGFDVSGCTLSGPESAAARAELAACGMERMEEI